MDLQHLIYEYKGSRYNMIDTGHMKIGQRWLSCVIYKTLGHPEIYVREHDDFFEKFTPVVKEEAPEEPRNPPKVKNADGTDHIQVA